MSIRVIDDKELDLIKKAIYDNDEDMLKQYFIKSTKRREKLNK